MADGSIASPAQATEASIRVDLAAAYRLVKHFGWDDLVFTHLSARIPGPEHHFLINPYGLLFDEITASNLVKIDLEGRPVDAASARVNPAGFTIHSAVHAAREDALCVMHLHTIAGTAVPGTYNIVLRGFATIAPMPQQRWLRIIPVALVMYTNLLRRPDQHLPGAGPEVKAC